MGTTWNKGCGNWERHRGLTNFDSGQPHPGANIRLKTTRMRVARTDQVNITGSHK